MQQPDLNWQDIDILQLQQLRRAFAGFATGVAIVSCFDQQQQPVGLTINSFSSVSLNPALILWSLVDHSPSRVHFEHAECFSISILSQQQHAIAQQFAKAQADKFQFGNWDLSGPAPRLNDGVAQFMCRPLKQLALGDHQVFIAEVQHSRISAKEPLLFCQGQFQALAELKEVA